MASMLRSTANSSTGEASDKESIKIVNGKDEKDRHATKISVEILKKEHVYVDANNNNNNSRMIHEFKKTVNNNDLTMLREKLRKINLISCPWVDGLLPTQTSLIKLNRICR